MNLVLLPLRPVIVLPFDRAMFFEGNENSRGFSLISFDILIKLLWPHTPITMGSAGFDFPRSIMLQNIIIPCILSIKGIL